MADRSIQRLLKPHLWLIRLIGVIVPRRLRADWKQEWESELRNREELLAEWYRLNWRSKFDLLRRSIGAFRDAMWMQSYRWEDEMIQDIRFGLLMLMKKPGFTLAAVLTLALGIGANTAIFSAVNPILFESLPYPHADRITMVWDQSNDGVRQDGTFGTYRELLERSRSFEALAVMRSWQPTMTGPTEPERLEGQRVSASYFNVLGVLPVIGHNFDSSDDVINSPRVAIISDRLWQRRFNGDSAIIGNQLTLDDTLYTIIGVMPVAFENILSPSAELWTPLRYDMSLPQAWGHHLRIAGRVRQDIGTDQARQELNQIAYNPVPEFPRVEWALVKNGFIVDSLQDEVTRGVRPAMLAVLVAAILVLAIACVNVTNLLLARGEQRRAEFAVRAAIGAARTRMIRQLLTESLLLALLGGALGMAIAKFGVQALVALSPPELPRVNAIGIDGTVFAFGLGITTLIGLIVGLVPALQASRSDLHIGLQQGSRRTTAGHRLTRNSLVVAEVALALVLMVSAGLLLRSLQSLFAVDPGFDASNLLTMQVQTSGRRFNDETTNRFFAQALEAVREVPGVTSAAFTSQLPLSGDSDEYGAHFEPGPNGKPEGGYSVFRYAVSPGYFETTGIPLRQGRLLDERDRDGMARAALISESLAIRKFAGIDPIGQRLHIGPTDRQPYTIVGVVGDVKQVSLAASQSDAVYTTTTQWNFVDNALSLVVRTRADSTTLVPAIRKAIWSVDKDQPIIRVASMDELLAKLAAERRFALILFETFGLVALALAAIGIYGVLSGSVTERTHEIGVRLALGAQSIDVLSLILWQGARLTINGVVIGLLAAWAATRLLAGMLYGVSATDPLTFAGVVILLLSVALFSCYLPARRATKVDPLIAIRHE